MLPRSVLLLPALLLGCARQPPAKLTVAAAANLTDVFGEIGKAFQAKTGGEVVFTYASTAQLAQQIENGAPIDLFAAADTEHVDLLIRDGKIDKSTRAVYAIGQLALWVPKGDAVGVLKDLTGDSVRFIAIAKPELAPYGQAAQEALTNAGLWEKLQPKIVYGNNISTVKQMAQSGNADATFTAYSLVLHDQGTILKVDPRLFKPIQQALGIVSSSPHRKEADAFRSFLLGDEGRAILSKNGYLTQ